MGVKLMVEVIDYAPETLTWRERFVLMVLAENARDATRTCWPGIEDNETFIRRSCLASRSQRYATIKALVDKGVLEHSRRGQKGVRAQYRIVPLMDPQGPGFRDPEPSQEEPQPQDPPAPQPPDPQGVDDALRVPVSVVQGPGFRDPEDRDTVVQGPGFSRSGSRFQSFRVPVSGTPSPQSPQSPQQSNPATSRRADQPPLIPAATLQLTASQQTVYDSLRWQAGRMDVTEDEARAVTRLVRSRLGSKASVNYLRKMGGPDGGGFADYLDDIRHHRAANVEKEIKALEESEPRCEHGTPAGRTPHPLHQDKALCPLCRTKVAAAENGPVTDPVIAEAINVYRIAYGGKPATAWLIQITQQLVALHGRGVGRDQLVDLASCAGTGHVGIIHAATQGVTE